MTLESMIVLHYEKDIVFWGVFLICFGVIVLQHIWLFKEKTFTLLFVYFLRKPIKWKCVFKKYYLLIFLIFLIIEKVISTSVLCLLVINFAIILYFKTFINPLSATPTKWSNILKQFVDRCRHIV